MACFHRQVVIDCLLVDLLWLQGVSSRAYIAGGSHNANFDGLVFYPRWSLPGCA
jgi:hypothetical protein